MSVLYNRLFKLLIDRKLSNAQLAERAGFSANIITRLKKDEYVSMESIEKICIALDCGVDDILEFKAKREDNGMTDNKIEQECEDLHRAIWANTNG